MMKMYLFFIYSCASLHSTYVSLQVFPFSTVSIVPEIPVNHLHTSDVIYNLSVTALLNSTLLN